MDAIRYEQIAANVARVDVAGAQVQVEWKCAVTGRPMGRSEATMSADESLGGRVGASVKRSIAYELIYGATRVVAGMLGGAAGRIVSNAAYTAADDISRRATEGVGYSEASRRAAIVVAFEAVRPGFTWDEARRCFAARDADQHKAP